MYYTIINPDHLQIQLPSNDINNSNFVFCNQNTLSKLNITVYAYRLMYNPNTKHKQHIVFIMLAQKLQDNVIGISASLQDTLCLQPNDKVQFERIPLQIIKEGKLTGMPNFQIAQKIELLLIQNEAQSLFDSNLLEKIQFDPFYFGVGQQFRIKLHELSLETFKKQNQSTKRRFLRMKAKYQKKNIQSHLILRFVVNGVFYKQDNLSIYYLHKQRQSRYFLYEPKKTQLKLQSIKSMRKSNTILTPLPRSHLKIFNHQCYLQIFKGLTKILLQQNYNLKKFAFLKSLQSYGFTQFLRYFAEYHKLNFIKYDCSKQSNIINIKQYFNQIYTRAPYLYYIKNINWIYELASANLDPKKTTLKFVESLLNDLQQNLHKKLDNHVIFVIFGYQIDNFGINQIQGPHLNMQISPESHKQINQLILNQYTFNKEQHQELAHISINLGWKQIQKILIKTKQFTEVKKKLEKLSQRQKVAKIPNVNWDDIGGLELAKQQIIQTILLPRNFPQIFDQFIKPRTGLLFYGPPGTGKTLLAKCIANQCKMNFISVKGPEMLNMYIGESQKNVRQTFERALNNKPCIIFFDQLDAIIPKRGQSSDSSQVMDRIVAQLLTQMDIIARQGDVFVIGATNRPDLLDPSIMRPGRFDKQIYLGICSSREDRINILKAQTKKLKVAQNVDFGQVVDLLPQNFTGADFYGLTSKAVVLALKQKIKSIEQNFNQEKHSWQQYISKQNPQVIIQQNHLISALDDIKPSVTLQQLKKFQELKQKYS